MQLEYVYSCEVRTIEPKVNLPPSERRYSASVVFLLQWLYTAFALLYLVFLCLLVFICLQYYDLEKEYTENIIVFTTNAISIVLAATTAVACYMASVKWYKKYNIFILFVVSCVDFFFFLTISLGYIFLFYTLFNGSESDSIIIVKNNSTKINLTHIEILRNELPEEETLGIATYGLMSIIDLFIASVIVCALSAYTCLLSFNGVKNDYADYINKQNGYDKKKSNYNMNDPRLIACLDKRIKRIYLVSNVIDNEDSVAKSVEHKIKAITEANSEHNSGMLSYLNGVEASEQKASVQPEITVTEISDNRSEDLNVTEDKDRMTPISWGDPHDHTIYNQDNINFDKIFNKLNINKKETL